MAQLRPTNPYDIKPPEPKVVPSNYTQGMDNLSSEDFLKIYMETLKYQDPFQPQDLSKMLDDMTKLNQVRYMNDMKGFMEGLKGWFNQITLLSSLNLVGKDFVFATDRIDALKGGQYYLLSSQDIRGATLRIMDGDDVIKELQVDINKGLNPINIDDLPRGQFSIKLLKNGMPVDGINLGVMGRVKSVSISGNELLFELENGELVSPSRLIYAGGI